MKTVTVIGAGGFVGQRVVRCLLDDPRVASVRAFDRSLPASGADRIEGDLTDPNARARAIDGTDAVIHLAAILGGAAESDPQLARKVNIDATLDLIDELSAMGSHMRFVFASTVAAYGPTMPDPVTDATPLAPTLLYGAQKVMVEVALSQLAVRGRLDAVSLRVAGVMARDGADAALKTAFMSRLFFAVQRSENITLPVAKDSRTWMTSVDTVAQCFVRAALLDDLGTNRAFTLPALCLSFGELTAALFDRFPDSAARVTYAPDPGTVAMFGCFPDLITETADRLGFARDADADALVARAF